jgi:hypothetical protein
MIANYIHTMLTYGLVNFEVGFVLVNLLRLLIALAVYCIFLNHKSCSLIHHKSFR